MGSPSPNAAGRESRSTRNELAAPRMPKHARACGAGLEPIAPGKPPMMTTDLTRRILLRVAGASSLVAAAVGAARAEGGAAGAGPTYANRTPMRIGMVTLRVRNLDAVSDFYRDVIGLAVIERSENSAVLGAG